MKTALHLMHNSNISSISQYHQSLQMMQSDGLETVGTFRLGLLGIVVYYKGIYSNHITLDLKKGQQVKRAKNQRYRSCLVDLMGSHDLLQKFRVFTDLCKWQ